MSNCCGQNKKQPARGNKEYQKYMNKVLSSYKDKKNNAGKRV